MMTEMPYEEALVFLLCPMTFQFTDTRVSAITACIQGCVWAVVSTTAPLCRPQSGISKEINKISGWPLSHSNSLLLWSLFVSLDIDWTAPYLFLSVTQHSSHYKYNPEKSSFKTLPEFIGLWGGERRKTPKGEHLPGHSTLSSYWSIPWKKILTC